MQELDWATKFELYWRDLFFWILVRPAGILYDYASALFLFPLAVAVKGTLFVFSRGNAERTGDIYQFLKKEILTLANCVTLYGLFLYAELLFLLWASWHGKDAAFFYSLSALFLDENDLIFTKISWLIPEIFLTDMLDGPLARVNHAVTALGTFLDHTRDYCVGFTALAIILASALYNDHRMTIFLFLVLIGFAGIFVYHIKFLWLKLGIREFSAYPSPLSRMRERIELLYNFALNEYQTDLLGRIQFGALAVSITSGLFYYSLNSYGADIIFTSSTAITLVSTYWYLSTLWNAYYERLRRAMQEKSEKIKTRMIVKTKEIKNYASEHLKK